MKKTLLLAAASAVLIAAPVSAQSTSTSARDRISQILGNLLGVGNSADGSLAGQWTANRRPLSDQRAQFEARVDADVRSGRLPQATGARLKSEYYVLVTLEAQHGADGTYTAAERSELTTRYNELLQVLADGRYADGAFAPRAAVSEGQIEFNRRVDTALAARRITRVAATRLKADYSALVRTEANYLRDGTLSEVERGDLDARLDGLDQRVGDVAYAVPATARTRLEAIARALPSSRLGPAARAQLLVEHGDLMRLESAYARLTPTADERAYLERRLTNLEARARISR